MKRLYTLTCLAVLPLWMLAQTANVKMLIGGNAIVLKPDHFLTEVKPGWKIVDIKLKDKTCHYLWGKQALQQADGLQPCLEIYLSSAQTLINYRLIRLKKKKQYRLLPKPKLIDNEGIELSPASFLIQPIGESGFRCTPLKPLQPGEYILVDTGQDTSDMQKVEVYAFTVVNLPTPSSAVSSLQVPAQVLAAEYFSQ